MSKTRNNHYVPQWYQEGFFEPGQKTLHYLDKSPDRHTRGDGAIVPGRDRFVSPTSRCFVQRDLYSTFFGATVNDEIERRLFGDIDGRGSRAVRAFIDADAGKQHRHFQTFFEYIDIQKIRTPKGLDWLTTQYPLLTQNELMQEMQGIRMMHCTIWSESVREIVSAEAAAVKFIVTDHPVTVYNHAQAAAALKASGNHDPSIALKASQTIFPLNRNFCLILTNLEYARDHNAAPLEKRTFARNYRTSMVRTDAFIRERKLTDTEVAQINFVLKSRARRFIAASQPEDLYPERTVSGAWSDLRKVFLPPENGLWHFGGELYAKYDSGHVHYQDEFGRTEKPREFLIKAPAAEPLRPADACGCGSGLRFRDCCLGKPDALRTSWSERSIRERNMMLQNGVANVLELHDGRDWVAVRRAMTDEKIAQLHSVYEALWPLETDLLKLLPKPDNAFRAVYTGQIHPTRITDYALGASLYFGELLVEHPFVHAGIVKPDFSPVKSPRAYRQECLKTLLFFLSIMPLVEARLVNLCPDPCNFDPHLREQMFHMAQARSAALEVDMRQDSDFESLMKAEFQRSIMALPGAVEAQLRKSMPQLDAAALQEALDGIEVLKERDPLAVLQPADGAPDEKAGQFTMMKLAPNFEMALYLGQATGACVVTDNVFRWKELRRAVYGRERPAPPSLAAFQDRLKSLTFAFPQNAHDVLALADDRSFAAFRVALRGIYRYVSELPQRGRKPNVESGLVSRFVQAHGETQSAIRKAGIVTRQASMACLCPLCGIQDNTVNRLLLMSSSEHHLPGVPLAFFIAAAT